MITIPTTLVLGAGASRPYGFPTGRELRIELCDPGTLIGLRDTYSEHDIKVFCDTFRRSQMLSIDAFLARRGNDHVFGVGSPTFAEIGKVAIAYLLMQREKSDELFRERPDHWYQYLWSRMSDSLDSFASNKIRIVTFNYDWSLEAYLLEALGNTFGVDSDKAAELLESVEILHVYGQPGRLGKQSMSSPDRRPYSSDNISARALNTAALGIRVIDEHRDDNDEVFARAYRYLTASKRICFIGFGFDETNVRRLQLARLTSDPELDFTAYATTIGLQDAERNRVINTLHPKSVQGRQTYGDRSTADAIGKYPGHLPEQYLRATGILF